MTTKRDIDILIECHDEALAKRNAIAVDIADRILYERPIGDKLLREYNFARLGVESTARDLENCMMIAANAEVFDG
jgi:hypothetical protein